MTNLTAQEFRSINDDAVILYKAMGSWTAASCVRAVLMYQGIEVDADTFENLVSDTLFWGGSLKA